MIKTGFYLSRKISLITSVILSPMNLKQIKLSILNTLNNKNTKC